MRSEFHPVVRIPQRRTVKNAVKLEGGTGCIESNSRKRRFWPWQKRNRNNRSAHVDSPSCVVYEGRMNETYDYVIQDYTSNNKDTRVVGEGKRVPQLLPTRQEALDYAELPEQPKPFDVGRYDEDRRGMYSSSLFVEEGSREETNRRTIHVGLDIGKKTLDTSSSLLSLSA